MVVDAPAAVSHVTDFVDVTSVDVLVKLAVKVGTSVLRIPDQWTGADVFFVDDGGTRFRYRAAARSDGDRRALTI
jgi:hypothetical protein